MKRAKRRSKKRHAAAALKKRRAKRALTAPKKRRTRRASRKHTHWGKVRAHQRKVNPAKKHHRRHRRAKKKNPGPWVEAIIGAVLAGIGYTVGSAAYYLLTQKTDPTFATLNRNRYITAVGLIGGGGAIAALLKKPIIGLPIAAAGGIMLAGPELYGRVLKFLAPPKPQQNAAGLGRAYGPETEDLGAAYEPGQLGAAYEPGQLGAVYDAQSYAYN